MTVTPLLNEFPRITLLPQYHVLIVILKEPSETRNVSVLRRRHERKNNPLIQALCRTQQHSHLFPPTPPPIHRPVLLAGLHPKCPPDDKARRKAVRNQEVPPCVCAGLVCRMSPLQGTNAPEWEQWSDRYDLGLLGRT